VSLGPLSCDKKHQKQIIPARKTNQVTLNRIKSNHACQLGPIMKAKDTKKSIS